MEGNEAISETAAMMQGEIRTGDAPIQEETQNLENNNNPTPEPTGNTAPETKPTPEPVSAFDFKKYGLESEEQLAETVNNYRTASERLKQLEEEVAKPKEYQWASPAQKALAESLAGWTGDINEGITTHIRLKSLDVDNMAGQDALKENFILEKLANPKMNRDKAEKLFAHQYGSLYDKANDEDEPDAEVMKIQLEMEEESAKDSLKTKQAQIKEAAEKAAQAKDPEQPVIAPEIINAMQREMQSVPEVLKELESLTFKLGENSDDSFRAVLEKDELELIDSEIKNILKNPTYYDATTGALKPEFSAKNVGERLAFAIKGKGWLMAALAQNKANTQIEAIKTIEQSAADRNSGSQGGGHAPRNEVEAMKMGTVRG